MRSLVDRRAGADPGRLLARFAIPTWLLSLLVHAGLLALMLITFPRIRRGIDAPVDEKARQVGIVLKSEADDNVVFENADKKFKEKPSLDEPKPAPSEIENDPRRADSAEAPLPKVENQLLALGGALPTTESRSLPRATPNAGGAMSRTTFWKVEAVGSSFVYVVDRSASMSHRGSLELAKQELFQSFDQLAEESKFQVVFYNTDAFLLPINDGRLLEASKLMRSRARKEIERITPEGGTNHSKPLHLAFSLKPEVVYYLTDADMLSDEEVTDLTRANRQASVPATVFAIEFGNGPSVSSQKPLRRLAAENDGTYSYINVVEFGVSVDKPAGDTK